MSVPRQSWQPCPPGEIARAAAAGLRARRIVVAQRIAAGSIVGLAIAFSAWFLFSGGRNQIAGDPGGIACRRVHELAEDYIAAKLDAPNAKRVDEHLADCAACRGMIAEMRTGKSGARTPARALDGVALLSYRPRAVPILTAR